MSLTVSRETTSVEFAVTKQDVVNAVKTYVFSTKYIKLAIKASIINIIYQRVSYSSKCFLEKEFNTIPFMSLVDECPEPLVLIMRKWFTGISHALEKKYLKEIHLFIVDDKTNTVKENYKFKLAYEEEIKKEKKKEKNDLTGPTEDLLSNLRLLGNTTKFGPENVSLQMELFYNDNAPSNYLPPFFETCLLSDSFKIQTEKQKGKMELFDLARLCTGFHLFKSTLRRHQLTNQTIHTESFQETPELLEVQLQNLASIDSPNAIEKSTPQNTKNKKKQENEEKLISQSSLRQSKRLKKNNIGQSTFKEVKPAEKCTPKKFKKTPIRGKNKKLTENEILKLFNSKSDIISVKSVEDFNISFENSYKSSSLDLSPYEMKEDGLPDSELLADSV